MKRGNSMKKGLKATVALGLVLCFSLCFMGCIVRGPVAPLIPVAQARDIGEWMLPVVANGEAFGMTKEVEIQELLAQDEVSMVLMHFWATWCSPATEDFLPQLDQVYREHKQDGLVLLMISIDTDQIVFFERIENYLDELEIASPVLWDYNLRVKDFLEIGAIPATFLVDKEGRIRYEHTGYTSEEIDIPPLLEAIDFLLWEM